ncbi:sigma-70 family RNA polymerase sigma factor [Priestia megaterium]|nr:sigma-70 family RNA polymerase sigma factor [Priestia megaterium]
MNQMNFQHNLPHSTNDTFTAFLMKNKSTLSTKLMKHFLKDYNRYQDLKIAVCEGNVQKWDILDQQFKLFYGEIRFLSYISILCKHFVRDSLSIRNKEASYTPIRLEQPVANEEQTTYGECIGRRDEAIWKHDFLAKQIEDNLLYRAFRCLTIKQQFVLHFRIVEGWSQAEIAQYFGISQQSVSYTYRYALNKLKKMMERKDGHV